MLVNLKSSSFYMMNTWSEHFGTNKSHKKETCCSPSTILFIGLTVLFFCGIVWMEINPLLLLSLHSSQTALQLLKLAFSVPTNIKWIDEIDLRNNVVKLINWMGFFKTNFVHIVFRCVVILFCGVFSLSLVFSMFFVEQNQGPCWK